MEFCRHGIPDVFCTSASFLFHAKWPKMPWICAIPCRKIGQNFTEFRDLFRVQNFVFFQRDTLKGSCCPDKSRWSSFPCFADKPDMSRCSTGLCSVDKSRSSRCSSGPFSVEKSRSSKGSCCPDTYRCSSGPCFKFRCSTGLRNVDMSGSSTGSYCSDMCTGAGLAQAPVA